MMDEKLNDNDEEIVIDVEPGMLIRLKTLNVCNEDHDHESDFELDDKDQNKVSFTKSHNTVVGKNQKIAVTYKNIENDSIIL